MMLNGRWLRLVESSATWDFLDTILRGYGQIIFCNHALTGLIVLIGFVDSPISGISSLIGSLSASITAILIRTEPSLMKSGLFSCNGALIGLALTLYLPVNPMLVLIIMLTSILSAVLMKFLINILSVRSDLPALSIPFVVVTWLGLLFVRILPGDFLSAYTLPPIFSGSIINRAIIPLLPQPVITIFYTVSGIFFQNNILIGVLALVGMLIYSRISPILGLAGGIIGLLLYNLYMPGNQDYATELATGFNCILIAIAFGGFFIRLTWQALLYDLFAVCAGAVTGIALSRVLSIIDIPPLASSFNLITLSLLCILRVFPEKARNVGLESIPLVQVGSPENNMNWNLSAKIKGTKQHVILSLPFSGMWYVSDGNNNKSTHSGMNIYAWDFVVLDENHKTCRFLGIDKEDYYSFGLPVLTPAAGTVVKVTSSIPDNTPPTANWEQSWGNYIIIDHGSNEFSEISHFKQHSISVREGDRVLRGQLLGYCGNSGLSMAPHIHYQLQNAGTLGANTIPARFHNYVIQKGARKITVKEGIPREKEFISNSHYNKLR